MTTYLRTSERNLFKRCQWAWERSYIDRLNTNNESTALWFGTGIHLAFEKYYIEGFERGRDPVETWIEYCEDTRANTKYVNTYLDGDSRETVNAQELGAAMLRNYLDHYGSEPHIEVIAAEQSFKVGVKYPSWQWDDDGENVPGIDRVDDVAQYVGTFDQVFRDTRTNKIFLRDWKTCASLGSSNTQYLPLDDQAGAYYAIADLTLRKKGLIGKDERIQGIVYDYLVKRKPSDKPRNAQGYVTNKPEKKDYVAAIEAETGQEGLSKLTKADLAQLAEDKEIEVFGAISATQPAPLLERKTVFRSAQERKTQVQRIQNDLEAMSLVRNGLVKATKTPVRECFFCEFRDICELDEAGRDWSDMAESIYSPWEPYESHIETEGV